MLTDAVVNPEDGGFGGGCAPTVVRDAAPLGYRVQRQLLKHLFAGQLAMSEGHHGAAMSDAFSVIRSWLASESPRIQARGLRAFGQWRMAVLRAVESTTCVRADGPRQ